MKKRFLSFVALALLMCVALCLASCDFGPAHEYADTYSYDDENHWYACTYAKCDAVDSFEAHDIEMDYVEVDGELIYAEVCHVCGYVSDDTVDVVAPTDVEELKMAIQQGGHILVSEDVVLEESLEIPEGVEVVIDLGDTTVSTGYQSGSTTNHYYAFANRGTLVIKGGTINARGVQNYGTLTIEEGTTINALDTNGGAAVWNYAGGTVTINGGTFTSAENSGYGAGAVSNASTMIINGGTFISNSWTYPVVNNAGAEMVLGEDVVVNGKNGVLSCAGGKLTVKGGEYVLNGTEATSGHVMYFTGGDVVIEGGLFKHMGMNNDGSLIYNYTNTTIKGGEFVIEGRAYGPGLLNGTLTVEGGDFTDINQFFDWGGKAVLLGGDYGFDVTKYAASGYSVVDNGDGSYKVALVPVADSTELSGALSAGAENVAIPEGTFTLPQFTSGTLNVVGDGEDTILNTNSSGVNTYLTYGDKDINFTNLTIKGQSSGQYNGFAHVSDLVFTDCVIDGTLTLYGESATFINCTFNLPAGCYIWTWGVGEVTFDDCEFYTAGKAILMYGEMVTTTMTVKNCDFYAENGDKAGAITNQNCAAIEIDSTLINRGLTGEARTNRYTLITENNTYSDNFSGEWRIKGADEFTVNVNGEEYGVLNLDGVQYEFIDGTKDVRVKED